MPREDWTRLKTGVKTELRMAGRGSLTDNHVGEPPVPLLGFSFGRARAEADYAMFVLEDCWREPLMAMSLESLEREGYATMGEFKDYWRYRFRNRRYDPMATVQVFRLRPMTSDDRQAMGARLLSALYEEWL